MYYPYYGYVPYVNHYTNQAYRGYAHMPQWQPAYDAYNHFYPAFYEEAMDRQQAVRGQATWTEGGPVTECGIPWSTNEYMTAAVGANAPYQCGQILKIRNLSSPGHKEVSVKVVDEVAGYPSNRMNLHRRAFEALGASLQKGVINIEISPAEGPEPEESKWGDYLSDVIQAAFPGYNSIEYHMTEKKEVSATEIAESFSFTLESSQETNHIKGTVHYNPNTERVMAVALKEV